MQSFKRLSCQLLLLLLPLSFAVADDAVEDRFFDSNGVQIRYTMQGVGNPVVLVHGFTVNLDTNWRLNGVWTGEARMTLRAASDDGR